MNVGVKLKKGDRIRLKVRIACGWKGLATVTADQAEDGADATVQFKKDGGIEVDTIASRYQIVKLKKCVPLRRPG